MMTVITAYNAWYICLIYDPWSFLTLLTKVNLVNNDWKYWRMANAAAEFGISLSHSTALRGKLHSSDTVRCYIADVDDVSL